MLGWIAHHAASTATAHEEDGGQEQQRHKENASHSVSLHEIGKHELRTAMVQRQSEME